MVRGLAPLSAALLLLCASNGVDAQDDARPKAALMRTATELGGMRGPLDRIARSALDELDVAEVTGTLALDLEQAQLALGCMSVSAECLSSVAEENDVQLLLAPRLDDTGDERILTVVLYDGRDSSVAQATRRIAADAGNDAVLDSVPGVLRELFGMEPPTETDTLESGDPDGGASDGDPSEPGETGAPAGEPIEEEEEGGIGAGGPVLLGVGGAALVGGVIAGVLFKSADDEWAAAVVGNDPAAAMEAAELRNQAQTRGRTATALLIGGGVLAAGGLVWLLVDAMGGDDDESSARWTPSFAVGGGEVAAGLSMEMDL